MTLKDFKERMIRYNEGTNNIPYLKCNVNSINGLSFLIDRIIFGKEFSFNPTKLLTNMLTNEDYRKNI